MGSQKSKLSGRRSTLGAHDSRKITQFLELHGKTSEQFDHRDIQKIWHKTLVSDLLSTYERYLMKNEKSIDLEQFVSLYCFLVRGVAEEKAACLSALLSPPTYISQKQVSYTLLCKYLSDLLESFFKAEKQQNDVNLKSWSNIGSYKRAIIEVVVEGICNDLPRTNGHVDINDLEKWLHSAGLVNALHSDVLTSMYSVESHHDSSLIPLAVLPSFKAHSCLDTSQVVFLNSCIPFENKAEWRFIYSSSTHGESFSKFAASITNQGPLILVLECNNRNRFGGFISENISPGPRWVGTDDSFLFTLTPKTEVFMSTGYNDHYVYFNINQTSLPNGLGMGGQFAYWGLWMDSEFGKGECSESCTTYKHYKMITSAKKFSIRNIEAWGVGEPPPSIEEQGLRGTTSVLDKEVAGAHLLEMMGRKTYSKGLREEPKL